MNRTWKRVRRWHFLICLQNNIYTVHDRDFNASINIKKQGLKILSGSGIESDIKQKRSKALPLGESMISEAHPISFAVGG
jgi:hypothetical protein